MEKVNAEFFEVMSDSSRVSDNLTLAGAGKAPMTNSVVTGPDIAESAGYGRPLRPVSMKRAGDVFAVVVMIVLLAPVLLLIAALVASSGPQIFFRQLRVGKDGKRFYCYKFRSMVPNAEEVLEKLLASDPRARAEWYATQKLRSDPRITTIGRVLRSTSMDELPQLINVLKGDMSLVGPRPVLDSELSRYGRARESYLSVLPGITGLWQVSGRSQTTYRRRVALDKFYARNGSFMLDTQILLKTVSVVLFRSGAW